MSLENQHILGRIEKLEKRLDEIERRLSSLENLFNRPPFRPGRPISPGPMPPGLPPPPEPFRF